MNEPFVTIEDVAKHFSVSVRRQPKRTQAGYSGLWGELSLKMRQVWR